MLSRFTSFFSRIDAGIVIAATLALFAAQALLSPGLPTSADLIIHIYRTLEFEQAWAPGVIVPRWAPNLAFGYGYPLFIFAPPLPYLLAMLFHLPGISLEIAFKFFLVLTLMLYAVGMYLLARAIYRSVAAGLVAAVAFTFAPFALREALHYGGNVPQLLAIGLFPWPLWCATQAVRTRRWMWTVLAAIFYAAIMLSHLFHALIFSPVFGGYLLLLVALHFNTLTANPGNWRQRTWNLVQPLLAAPIGLLLAAFFWLPAFIERNLTRAQADIYLEKSPFFIRYPYWPELVAWIAPLDTRAANPYIPLTLGAVTLILAGLGILSAIIFSWQHQNHLRRMMQRLLPAFYFAAVAAAATFMTLPLSQPVWEIVEILQVAEFPWRMLGLANLGLAVVAGGAVLLSPQKFRGAATGIVIAIQLLAVAPYLYPVVGFVQVGNPTIANQIRYERSSQSIGTTTLGEYLPQSVKTPPTTSPLVDAFEAGHFPERLDRNSLPAGSSATLLKQNAISHHYQIDTPEPVTVRLFHFDFPGWQAKINGQPVPIIPEPESGLMLIQVPAGTHTLAVQFGETPVRIVALGLSGLALVGLAAVGLWQGRRGAGAQGRKGAEAQKALLLDRKIVILVGLLIIAALWITPGLKPLFTVTSPPNQVVTARHQTDVRFANNIQLAGYDISRRVVKPGDYLQVVLYWQTDSAPYRVNLQPFVHLDRLDNFSTIVDATNYTPGDVTTETNMPTFHWDNLRYVRDEHDLIIPAGTPPQAYAVRVGLLNPEQGGQLIPLAGSSDDTIWLDTINVAPGSDTPQLAQSPAVQFSAGDDTINLTGFELGKITPDRLEFTLAWHSATQPHTDYTIFAQLLDAERNLVTSFDRPPLDGAYPTLSWLPKQTVIDPRYIPLEGIPSGNYTLIVGLYNPKTGQRMITGTGADFVELSPVTVTNDE